MATCKRRAQLGKRRLACSKKTFQEHGKGFSQPEETERLIAWLKKSQAVGGFLNHCKTTEPFLIRDGTTGFLFHLVNKCNDNALRLALCPSKHLLAVYLLRLAQSTELKADEVERRSFRVLLLNFVVDGLALECAVEQFSKEYFGGFQILFGDVQQKLSERNQAAKQLLRGYNFYAPKAGFELITEEELQSSISERMLASMDELTRLSRATAEASFGHMREARELLLPLVASLDLSSEKNDNGSFG